MSAYHQRQGMDGPPIKEGAIFGAVSFIAGYITTLLVVAIGEGEEFTDDLIESAGWLYYNGQFADLEFVAESGGQSESSSVNYLTDDTILGEPVNAVEVPELVYHLIPIIVLVAAGFALARYVNAREARDGAVAGATLAIGVVGLAVLGTFLFSIEEAGFGISLEMSPALADGVLLVGLVYPAVFGAIGGVISTQR